jgi:hypothetical protein
VLAVALPAIFIGARCIRPGDAPARSADVKRAAAGIRGYVRDGAATYLAVPRWYVVYSIEEYAQSLSASPSRFPYLAAGRQYWEYYGAMCEATGGVYPVDVRAHLVLGVIGVGFTAESVAKGAWENTAGRLTEWLGGHGTEEDGFARRTAAEYGRFVHTAPWYEFPFGARLVALWRETAHWGRAPARKWERKLALSAEYGVKAASAWLVRQGVDALQEPEAQRIHAWIEPAPPSVLADRRVRRVKDVERGGVVVTLPRFEPFAEVVRALVRQGRALPRHRRQRRDRGERRRPPRRATGSERRRDGLQRADPHRSSGGPAGAADAGDGAPRRAPRARPCGRAAGARLRLLSPARQFVRERPASASRQGTQARAALPAGLTALM